VSVAVRPSTLTLTVAVTGDPPCGVSVNVDPVILEGFIASLNVAVIADVTATPVLWFVGLTEETIGAGPAAVVKIQL
jgi:hypothetical protein